MIRLVLVLVVASMFTPLALNKILTDSERAEFTQWLNVNGMKGIASFLFDVDTDDSRSIYDQLNSLPEAFQYQTQEQATPFERVSGLANPGRDADLNQGSPADWFPATEFDGKTKVNDVFGGGCVRNRQATLDGYRCQQ